MDPSQFLMETNKYCFLCIGLLSGGGKCPSLSTSMTEASTSSSSASPRKGSNKGKRATIANGVGNNNASSAEGIVTSFQKVCQHLKIDLPRVFQETIRLPTKQSEICEMEKWDLKGKFCADCANVADTFSELYVQLEAIQLKVEAALSIVQRKFLEGEADRGRAAEFKKNMMSHPFSIFHFAFVETLRKEALEKCGHLLDKKSVLAALNATRKMTLKQLRRQQRKQHPVPMASPEPEIVEVKPERPAAPEQITLDEPEQAPPTLSPIISSVRGSYGLRKGKKAKPEVKAAAAAVKEAPILVEPQPSTSAAPSTTGFFFEMGETEEATDMFSDSDDFELERGENVEEDEDELEEGEVPPGQMNEEEVEFEDQGVEVMIDEGEENSSDTNLTNGNVNGNGIPHLTSSAAEEAASAATSSQNQNQSHHKYGLRRCRFICKYCPRRFRMMKDLEIHRKRFHAGNKYRCLMCPKAFQTPHGLLVHNKKIHVKLEPGLGGEGAGTSNGNANGNSTNNIFPRRRTGGGGKGRSRRGGRGGRALASTECDICQKKFKLRAYMIAHRHVHFGKKWKCEYCSKEFTQSSNYYTHRSKKCTKIAQLVAQNGSPMTKRVNQNGGVVLEDNVFPSTSAAAAASSSMMNGIGNPGPVRFLKTEPVHLDNRNPSNQNQNHHDIEVELGSFIFPLGGGNVQEYEYEDPLASAGAGIPSLGVQMQNPQNPLQCGVCHKIFKKVQGLKSHFVQKHRGPRPAGQGQPRNRNSFPNQNYYYQQQEAGPRAPVSWENYVGTGKGNER